MGQGHSAEPWGWAMGLGHGTGVGLGRGAEPWVWAVGLGHGAGTWGRAMEVGCGAGPWGSSGGGLWGRAIGLNHGAAMGLDYGAEPWGWAVPTHHHMQCHGCLVPSPPSEPWGRVTPPPSSQTPKCCGAPTDAVFPQKSRQPHGRRLWVTGAQPGPELGAGEGGVLGVPLPGGAVSPHGDPQPPQ